MCVEGFYKPEFGAGSCTSCTPISKTVVDGKTACVCSAGYTQDPSDATACIQCPADTYKSQPGSTACEACNAPMTTINIQRTECNCVLGYTKNSAKECVKDESYGTVFKTAGPISEDVLAAIFFTFFALFVVYFILVVVCWGLDKSFNAQCWNPAYFFGRMAGKVPPPAKKKGVKKHKVVQVVTEEVETQTDDAVLKH
jgi:hypothetical protein